jgi:hypothetical protein
MDSVKNSEQYISLYKQLQHHRSRSNNYTGMSLFADIVHSDYDRFNESIAPGGFPAFNPISYRIGFGISSKHDRLMSDFYFGVLGINSRSKKGEEKITTSLSNLLQYDFGIDLLKSSVLSLYPYAGLSLRMSSLKYKKPAQTNPGYTNITNMVINDQNVSTSSLRLGYQAGLGLDVAIYNRPGEMSKTMLFIKAGTNGPVWRDAYEINNIKYKPGIRHGDWMITVGIKFGAKV